MFKYIYWMADVFTHCWRQQQKFKKKQNAFKSFRLSKLQQNHAESAMLLPSCAFVVRNVHLCQGLPPVGAQIIPAAPVLPPDLGPVGC